MQVYYKTSILTTLTIIRLLVLSNRVQKIRTRFQRSANHCKIL